MATSGADQPTDKPAPAEFQRIPNHGIVTASVMMATILQSLDSTIANVALPQIQGSLSATQDQMAWVLTSYIVATAITIPLTGWMAGQFGRRRIFLISIFTFTVASAMCGLAETLPQLVLFRFIQGIGGAALVPMAQAVLFDINPPKDFGRAMSLWGAGITIGPIIGPALGGWLTEEYSWRWVFFINLPVGALAFFGLLFTMPENRHARGPFDFFGFATLGIAIGALQVMLDRGQLVDWFSSPEIIFETALAGTAFYLFLVHTFTHPKPFLNPLLFKDRNFVASTVFIFVIGVFMFATLALLPPMLQNQLNYPVVLSGLVLAPRGLGIMIGMTISGRLVTRFDVRLIMGAGLLLTVFSLWQMTQYSLVMSVWPIVIPGLLQGMSLGLVYVPLSTVAFTTLPAVLRNEGTSFFNLVRNIGSSVGISVVTFLLVRNTQTVHATLAEHVTPYNIDSPLARGVAGGDTSTLEGIARLNAVMTDHATLIAYINDFHLIMILTLLSIPFLLLVRKAKPAAGSHTVLE